MTLSSGLIAAVALIYMAILFAIAFYGDRRAAPMPPNSSGRFCRSTSGRS
jgi:hypothetical protein